MTCPYPCRNKTEYGYCKTSGCINPEFIGDIFHLHNANIFPDEARVAVYKIYKEMDGGEK